MRESMLPTSACAVQTKEVMDAMTADVGLDEAHCLRVDGGASTNDLLMQLQADLLQVCCCRLLTCHSACLLESCYEVNCRSLQSITPCPRGPLRCSGKQA